MENITVKDSNLESIFIETEEVQSVIQRASAYLEAEYPIHLRGPAGIGKTTLAMHIARSLGRPLTVIFGNDEVSSGDFLGGQFGYRKKAVVDNYIHSVLKTEEFIEQQWIDGRIIEACREGHTLIYDEFSRSSPEVNNILLSILEERILQMPAARTGENFIKVHPEFRAIFTSNPNEYAGVYKTQEALLDRMITINLDYWDRDTEIEITAAKAEIDLDSAGKIIDIIRKYREMTEKNRSISLRNAIMLAKIVKLLDVNIDSNDKLFVQICGDIVGGRSELSSKISMDNLIRKVLSQKPWNT